MCGIYGARGCGLGTAEGLAALATIAHRGPDGRGHHHDERRDVFLGHARLAVIDLSEAGAQPMSNEDGALWLVFNGEIYNHADLRAGLVERGHRFRSRSDAEVVLHLFEERGIEALELLVGMFAFALWDGRDDTLWLARDRLGIKPLAYYDDGKRFAFASEIKALRATPGLDLELDPTAFYDYLTHQYVPAPKTIHRRVRKLPAAHWLRLRGGRAEVRRWWEPPLDPDAALDEEQALERLDELLATAARDHLVADVPVGAFLSGGVDSSLVVGYVAGQADETVQAFTTRFVDGANDEADRARWVAQQTGLEWSCEEFSTQEVLDRVPTLPGVFDEPFGDQAALPLLGLSRMAAKSLKVVVSGDGGDETHLGYGRYFKERGRRIRYAIADAIGGRWVASTPLGRVPGVRGAVDGRYGRWCYLYGGIPRMTKELLITDRAPELRDYDDYWAFREHDRADLPDEARQQAFDYASSLPEGYMTKVDRTSMRHGLEVRPPLLDHRLVEFAGSLPTALKARGGESKHLLKRLLARRLPEDFVRMPKRSFSLPLKRYVSELGMFRPSEDLVVPGAFRVPRERIERVLGPRRDHHHYWLLAVLAEFVRSLGATDSGPLLSSSAS